MLNCAILGVLLCSAFHGILAAIISSPPAAETVLPSDCSPTNQVFLTTSLTVLLGITDNFRIRKNIK